jgi:hypothetical protein
MESEIINLNNLKLYNIKNNIFKIENIKLRISLFLYDYKYSIINNRLDLLKNNDYLDINLIDNQLLIQVENSTNKKIKKFVYYKYFLNKGIIIPDEWFDIYLQDISIIDEWEIYRLYSVINRQIVDRPENNNEKWIDVAVRYIGMGLFCVISLLKNEKKCFFRISGGTTGYDYMGNRNAFINFDPYSDQEKLFDINKSIQIMNKKSEDLYYYIQKGNYPISLI